MESGDTRNTKTWLDGLPRVGSCVNTDRPTAGENVSAIHLNMGN